MPGFTVKDKEARSIAMPKWVKNLLAQLQEESHENCPLVFLPVLVIFKHPHCQIVSPRKIGTQSLKPICASHIVRIILLSRTGRYRLNLDQYWNKLILPQETYMIYCAEPKPKPL